MFRWAVCGKMDKIGFVHQIRSRGDDGALRASSIRGYLPWHAVMGVFCDICFLILYKKINRIHYYTSTFFSKRKDLNCEFFAKL